MNKITSLVEQRANLSEDLNDKFSALFPSWVTIVATVLAFTILLIVLTLLVWKPVKKMVADRQAYIQNNIDAADAQKVEATNDREKANQELVEARVESAKIVSDAKIAAELKKSAINESAKLESKKILADAKQEIEAEKVRLERETKQEIVEVALAAAAKIVEKEVDSKVNRKLVNDFIKQA
ncbi:F0F1 ATP synthase subunit B [Mycoplasma marinum]|uniref:ATP synthase subunit b n=1 Tax=Mycoplasma marinum TaxID=1937190 RepID=A0A4V2NIE0_9MOLU|nr:F0F1 ATP synthase subunit B [Mycoplasma marinum]TCG12036.1 ATP synthase F0 subunit B [Mycoplasma marinum]